MPPWLRRIGSLPAMPRPARSGWIDGALAATGLVLGLIEVAMRPERSFGAPATIVALGLVLTLAGRTSHPGAMVAIVFGALSGLDLLERSLALSGSELNVHALLLALPHALVRWGSGREALLGGGVMVIAAGVGFAATSASVGEVIGGSGLLLASASTGLVGRLRARARGVELEQAKLQQRQALARELHDTVAHRVSAIAIRAQAGQAVAEANPPAVLDALVVIEAEARRGLGEMRALIETLREEPGPRVESAFGLAALGQLRGADGLEVDLKVRGDATDLSAAVSGAIYRIAQESITNAGRHARAARRVRIEVEVGADAVDVCVEDDGGPVVAPTRSGFGLRGMIERAELLGGWCEAGPAPSGGWRVKAHLPRRGSAP